MERPLQGLASLRPWGKAHPVPAPGQCCAAHGSAHLCLAGVAVAGWRQWLSQQHRAITRQSQQSRDTSHLAIATIILICQPHTHQGHPELGQQCSRTKGPGQKSLLGATHGAGQDSTSPRGSGEPQHPKPGHRWSKGNAMEVVMCAGTWCSGLHWESEF